MRRGDVDDAPPLALSSSAACAAADGVEGRGKVDRDDAVPLLDREFVDRRDMLDAGIVDQDVDRAELFARPSSPAPGNRRPSTCRPGCRPPRPHVLRRSSSAMAWSAVVSEKELTTTLQPSAASAWAIARPMPEVEPVTMAVFFASAMMAVLSAVLLRRNIHIALQQKCEGDGFCDSRGRQWPHLLASFVRPHWPTCFRSPGFQQHERLPLPRPVSGMAIGGFCCPRLAFSTWLHQSRRRG